GGWTWSCILDLQLLNAASVLGLTDPRLCYMLDGFLFIYAVVMTALFVKAKVVENTGNAMYGQLFSSVLQQRRKNPQDTVYTSLQKDKMGEAYSEIGMKGERRRGKGNEGLYQGLSAATKDTYDALQMQPLPPR
uniref:T-cell surface glycoprotein CD3 zeta chain n=1 Tax=Taeniopygia guttata TaxID=59729 RepID=H0ZTG1_TAEGU